MENLFYEITATMKNAIQATALTVQGTTFEQFTSKICILLLVAIDGCV